jgi:hypothetical protein
MKHMGIEYEIRARPGVDEWTWTIYPASSAAQSGETKGSKRLAEFAAKQAIERWLKRRRRSDDDYSAVADEPRP